jgi:hypothetical protein
MEHSLVTTAENKMLCRYCKSKCVRGRRERKRRWWHECEKCHVNFLVSLQGRIETIQFKHFTSKNHAYSLNLYLKEKKSELWEWTNSNPPDKEPHYKPEFIKGFDNLIDANPENFQYKIKTYLVFL